MGSQEKQLIHKTGITISNDKSIKKGLLKNQLIHKTGNKRENNKSIKLGLQLEST